jgi:serine/threonine-protein kinase
VLTVPGLPAKVASLCVRCLSRNPAIRPTAAEAATILGAGPPAPRTRRLVWLAVPVAVALAGVLAVLLLTGNDHGHPSGSAAPTPTVSILVSFAPAPTDHPGATSTAGTRPPGRPSGQPSGGSASPAPPPTPQTAQAAAKAVLDIVDRRSQSGEIRSDVALDIRNQVNNLVADDNDAAHRIDVLRHNLSDRTRDHSISDAAYQELDAAVANLGRALTSSAP